MLNFAKGRYPSIWVFEAVTVNGGSIDISDQANSALRAAIRLVTEMQNNTCSDDLLYYYLELEKAVDSIANIAEE